MRLRIITPKEVSYEAEITEITAPGADGEVTILPKHVPLFTQLKEGVIRIDTEEGEMFFSIGGGYLETDGKELNVLVSRAYGQDQIDEAEVLKAQEKAEKLLENAKTDEERHEAMMTLRRSLVDLKLLKKVGKHSRNRNRPIN